MDVLSAADDALRSCTDSTRLMPECEACIPGLSLDTNGAKCVFSEPKTARLRKEIAEIAKQRFGEVNYYLYPYLSVMPLLQRQIDVAKMINNDRPRRILDIGPYTNPIWKFIDFNDYCPELIVSLEPCGEVITNTSMAWRSVLRSCSTNGKQSTHLILVPQVIQIYFESDHFRESQYDAVVCIGCDGHFGPSGKMITSLRKPFFLYLEYPPDYTPSRNAFNTKVMEESLCGSPAVHTKEYRFKPEDEPHLKPYAPFSLHRLLSAYHCKEDMKLEIKAMLEKFHVNCSVAVSSYQDLACRAERHNILGVQDQAFFPSGKDREGMIEILEKQPARFNNCTICADVLSSYAPYQSWERIPFYIHNTSASAHLSLKYGGSTVNSGTPSESPCLFVLFTMLSVIMIGWSTRTKSRIRKWSSPGLIIPAMTFLAIYRNICTTYIADFPDNTQAMRFPLRIDDANHLLVFAEDAFKKGGDSEWDALAAATTARLLLHAGKPEDVLMEKGGLLYKAIVDYNIYFKNTVGKQSQEYPSEYTHRLAHCPQHIDTSFRDVVRTKFEPILTTSRNHGYYEFGNLIDMAAYRVLPTFQEFYTRSYRKKILIDVGANGFYGSPKAIIDMYAPFSPFDEVHLFEPDIEGMEIPEYYMKKYNIKFHRMMVTVGTRDSSDILSFLRANVSPDDFLVLKYDVDDGLRGLTMEWGFLSDLVHSEEIALVDELFIELHFWFDLRGLHGKYRRHPNPNWKFGAHSMLQAYEVQLQLRECGLALHAWP